VSEKAQRKPDEKPALNDRLRLELAHAESEAWAALGRYKFQMFGYWAAIWVHLNRIGGFKQPNPFRRVVKLAREVCRGDDATFEADHASLLIGLEGQMGIEFGKSMMD
jgi:hypothetical protein